METWSTNFTASLPGSSKRAGVPSGGCAGPLGNQRRGRTGRPAGSGAGGRLWVDRNLLPVLAQPLVLHHAVHGRIERVVATEADVRARVDDGAELADEDAAGVDALAAVHLHPAPLSGGVAPVARAALSLLVSHGSIPGGPRFSPRPRRPSLRCRAAGVPSGGSSLPSPSGSGGRDGTGPGRGSSPPPGPPRRAGGQPSGTPSRPAR